MEFGLNKRVSSKGVIERSPIPNPTIEEIRKGWKRIALSDLIHLWTMPRNLEELGTTRKSKTIASKTPPVSCY